jgi:transposase
VHRLTLRDQLWCAANAHGIRVRAVAWQAEQLLAWAAAWPERTWAVEGASGLGNLLAQQLVTAGEVVLDVQPKMAARVRLLASGNTNKNDPSDARSVAVAALRSRAPRRVAAEDHMAVLAQAHQAGGPGRPGRRELAAEFLADPRRLDAQIRGTRTKLAAAVQASGTTLTGIFGAGAVIAAAILGQAGDASQFGDRDRFAACNGTAPIEVFSGGRKIHRLSLRGNRRLNHAIHMAAITQIRYAHSPGRAYFDRKPAEGKTGKEALRCLKRQISDAIYARLQTGTARRARGAPMQAEGPGGQSGNGALEGAILIARAERSPNALTTVVRELAPLLDSATERQP